MNAAVHSEAGSVHDSALERIREALTGLRFGSVSVTIHEGRIVQIDVTEKKRFAPH